MNPWPAPRRSIPVRGPERYRFLAPGPGGFPHLFSACALASVRRLGKWLAAVPLSLPLPLGRFRVVFVLFFLLRRVLLLLRLAGAVLTLRSWPRVFHEKGRRFPWVVTCYRVFTAPPPFPCALRSLRACSLFGYRDRDRRARSGGAWEGLLPFFLFGLLCPEGAGTSAAVEQLARSSVILTHSGKCAE